MTWRVQRTARAAPADATHCLKQTSIMDALSHRPISEGYRIRKVFKSRVRLRTFGPSVLYNTLLGRPLCPAQRLV